jgi:hypothetical protein
MKLHKFALAIFLGAASIAASADDSTISQSPDTSGGLSSAHNAKRRSDALRIVEPKYGNIVTGTTTVKAVVRVGNGIRPKSLRITLNGKNVTRRAQEENCGPDACRWTAELSKADRLLSGANQLVAFARTSENSIMMSRTNFDYDSGLGAGENKPQWLAPSVGLSLNSGGAQPWVTLTTGWPANMQDSLDPTENSLPYRDTTFPTANDTPCGSRYQVVVLNRNNPAVEDAYWCVGDSGSLKTKFAGLQAGAEIVLVGTTLNNNADSGLDTTAIGGTNYSSYSAAWQPQGYAAIGVSGAAPGSAYESYYLPGDVGKAYQTNPFAKGLLAVDGNNNYNFHAGNNIQFEVHPNDPDGGTSFVFVAEGKTIHGWNPPAGSNGFWLLILDRVTSLPIDASYASGSPCQPYSDAETCGTFYPTGNTDSNVAAQAALNLEQALDQSTYRQLIVLTTLGQPFQSGNANSAAGAITWLGGTGYLLPQLTTPTSTYTLVAPGLRSPNLSPVPTRTPFSKGVVNSSSAFTQQGQTGIVRGVMARDNNGLYLPSVSSQDDGKMNGSGATALSIDYDFYSISTLMPIDWPLTDTAGHMTAYHWASLQFSCAHYSTVIDGVCQPDPHGEDVRFWYVSPTRNSDMGTHNEDFLCPNSDVHSPCNYPGDGLGFTEQDLADVNAELYSELTALHDTDLYLGQNGIGGLIQQSYGTGGVLADDVIEATYEVLENQVMPVTQSTKVSASMCDWQNLLAGITSVGAAALGPLDMPISAAAMGVTSGLLWTGSALAPWLPVDPATPPNYEDGFDVTLGQLQKQAEEYAGNLALSYDTSLDNIYSDWGKLSATGVKTSNSSTGWYFDNEISPTALANKLQDGVRRALYLQLMPQFYSLDTYAQQPVSTIDKLGMFYSWGGISGAMQNSCTASYSSSVPSLGWAHYATPGVAGATDIFVMGGAINNQGTQNVSESLPSNNLLGTLLDAPTDGQTPGSDNLNIPYDLVYGTFALPSRSGPNMGTYDGVTQCYKPGCEDHTEYSNQSSCIAP